MTVSSLEGLEKRYADIGGAAFALARRICRDDAVAADVVERAFASAGTVADGAVGDGLVLRLVRELACRSRGPVPVTPRPTAVSRPPAALAGLAPEQWRVLDLVALRGAAVCEAALRLGMSEAAVLAHLHNGLCRTRGLLSGGWEPHDDAQAPRLAQLG